MSARGDALRLAIYLDAAGLTPECEECRTWDDVVAALSVQFFSLSSEVRRDAKAHAGLIASQGGLIEVGRAILADHPLLNDIPDNTRQPRRPRCAPCQKPTWASWDAALQFCQTNGAANLQPFACPSMESKWHITGKPRM